jgi:PAS domain S-box-containing protein
VTSAETILIVEDDAPGGHVLGEILSSAGFASVTVGTGDAALQWLATGIPLALLLDLEMPEPAGRALLAHVRSRADLRELPVVVFTAPESDEDVQQLFAAGANDYVHKPVRSAELVARIRGQVQLRQYRDQLRHRELSQETVLELTQKLASTLDLRDILFTVVERLARSTGVDRCSIVLFGEAGSVGYVLASSDDEKLRDLAIDLRDYPEIREVVSTGRALVIPDAGSHPLLEVVRKAEPARGFNSLAIVPIVHDQRALGVLFLRARARLEFLDHELSLVSTIASATAIALRSARILKTLRDQSEESTFAREEAERRLRLFRRYADFFESAAHGMLVIDRSGAVLFGNPGARVITGFSEAELLSSHFQSLVDPAERARAERLLLDFSRSTAPQDIDFVIRTRSGEQRIVGLIASSVLHESNAMLLTFRDVTQERRTAIELKQTKEFLERVIDSSVDGIVSANLRGTVLLFNRAAARIFGYAPEDVIGKLRVEKLYPPGVARDVMRRIRDPELSGYGKLEDYRVDMLRADGQTIQVLLSASLVVDNGRPIGSVGIFTDIRDKLRIQAELEHAQRELNAREKQDLVAELAGTAAHELNQPLTSIIGYAGLLRRRLSGSPEHLAALDVIIDQSERMAEIVRKVGRITKYETMTYVGDAKILDLEKASSEKP